MSFEKLPTLSLFQPTTISLALPVKFGISKLTVALPSFVCTLDEFSDKRDLVVLDKIWALAPTSISSEP